MKLQQSVLPLRNMLNATIFSQKEFQSSAKDIFKKYRESENIKCPYTALRYAIWHGLSQQQKDKVINHSDIECIGGYYQYNDTHLDALLRKVLPTTHLVKIIA